MKKILCISLLCLALTGCGSKTKEVDEDKAKELLEQEIEAAEDSVYAVMDSIELVFLESVIDDEQISLPLVVTCKAQNGKGVCTYGNNETISSSQEMPTAGTFTLTDDRKFVNTYDIVVGDFSCTLENSVAKCSKMRK